MTFSGPAATPASLVLLAHGPAGPVRALLEQAGPQLAAALALPWAGLLDAAEPSAALAHRPAGLAGLPQDPGCSLETGGHWAELLGAWRQPAVVLLTAEQVAWGQAAASTALLTQQAVPLLGLVQWGEPWDRRRRRREGLPWLGWLLPQWAVGADPEQGLPLREAARLRWARLAADRA